jgi:hypothetical protein
VPVIELSRHSLFLLLETGQTFHTSQIEALEANDKQRGIVTIPIPLGGTARFPDENNGQWFAPCGQHHKPFSTRCIEICVRFSGTDPGRTLSDNVRLQVQGCIADHKVFRESYDFPIQMWQHAILGCGPASGCSISLLVPFRLLVTCFIVALINPTTLERYPIETIGIALSGVRWKHHSGLFLQREMIQRGINAPNVFILFVGLMNLSRVDDCAVNVTLQSAPPENSTLVVIADCWSVATSQLGNSLRFI